MEITAQQAIEVLLRNGMTISVGGGINDFILTLIGTLIGAVFGGMITLKVNRTFELERLRINNVIEMHKSILPRIEECQKALGIVQSYFESNEENDKDEMEETDVIKHDLAKKAFEDAFFLLNTEVNNYEIELSMFLSQYDELLKEVLKYKAVLQTYDNCNWTIEEFLAIRYGCTNIVDKLATLSEDISEYKRRILCGKKT